MGGIWGTAVCIGILLRADRFGFRFPVGSRDFCFLHSVKTIVLGPPSVLFIGYRVSFSEVKRVGREVYCSPSCRVEVKNEWSYTYSPLSLYAIIACTRTVSVLLSWLFLNSKPNHSMHTDRICIVVVAVSQNFTLKIMDCSHKQ